MPGKPHASTRATAKPHGTPPKAAAAKPAPRSRVTTRRPRTGGTAARRTRSGKGLSLKTQILLVVGMTVALVAVAFLARDWMLGLGNWGYVGAFLINGISSAAILLPAPGVAILLVMAQDFNPLWLGIAAGLGGALGSFTSYIVGRVGAKAVRPGRVQRWTRASMHRCGGGILFFFSLIPFLPMDVGGLMAGATRYSVPRYFLYVGTASVIKMVAVFYMSIAYVDWFRGWVERDAPYLQWAVNLLNA